MAVHTNTMASRPHPIGVYFLLTKEIEKEDKYCYFFPHSFSMYVYAFMREAILFLVRAADSGCSALRGEGERESCGEGGVDAVTEGYAPCPVGRSVIFSADPLNIFRHLILSVVCFILRRQVGEETPPWLDGLLVSAPVLMDIVIISKIPVGNSDPWMA